MLRKSLTISASLGLAIVSTAPALADICFEYTSGGGVGVAVGAKVPAHNTCERVTIVGADASLATGSICKSQLGDARPTLYYHYVLMGCTGSYFETATCHVDLGQQEDLPSGKPEGQDTSCTGVFAGLTPNQSGPLRAFSNYRDLKAWNCNPIALQGSGAAPCGGVFIRRRAPQ